MHIDTPFLEQALAKYFDNPVVADFKVMGEGQENTSVKVTLASGKTCILRVWGETHSAMGTRKETDIQSELDFMIRCHEQGIPVPEIYISRAGNRYEKLPAGNDYVVMDYVRGELPAHATTSMVCQIAEAMARMHCLAETFRYPVPRSWPGTITEMTSARLRKLPDMPISEDLRSFIEPIRQSYEIALQTADLDSLPHGLIHGDIMWENLKFQGERLEGIFDFDDCHDGYFIEDIAKSLVFDLNDAEHCFFGVHGENVQVFLDAYSAIRPLTEQERQLLPFFFTTYYLFRMMRYMLKKVDGQLVYWERLPALRERYEQNQSFFLPAVGGVKNAGKLAPDML